MLCSMLGMRRMILTGSSTALQPMLLIVALAVLLFGAQTAAASPGDVARSSPERCAPAELSERGEPMMAEMAASSRATRQMSDAMRAVLGKRGVPAMHETMGAASGRCPGRFAAANMGMSGTMNGGMMHGVTDRRGDGTMMEGGGMVESGSGTDWGTVTPIVLLFVVLIVGVAASLLRRPWSARSRPASMVNERLARGEIDVDEHRRLRSALQR